MQEKLGIGKTKLGCDTAINKKHDEMKTKLQVKIEKRRDELFNSSNSLKREPRLFGHPLKIKKISFAINKLNKFLGN
jgi:hypothetical protein